MEFEEMKMIWDSQNHEPLYAMNEAALHRVVHRRLQDWQRCLSRSFAAEISVGLLCSAVMLAYAGVLTFGDPTWLVTRRGTSVTVSPWDIAALLTAGAIWIYYSAYMMMVRTRQLRREEAFESTLRGDIERALAYLDFQVDTARNIVWWGILPAWAAATLWVLALFHLKGAPPWAYLLVGFIALFAFVAVVVGKQRSITHKFAPRRRELEALRAKLADPQR